MREEEKCMKDLLLSTSYKTAGMWDDLNCWPPAFLGETVSQPCPEFFNSGGKVHRNCTNNGWTDLLIPHEDACGYSFNESLLFLGESSDSHLYFSYVKTMYTVGYTISLISLIIAITIFCVFRKLHCTRNYIHIQLFISFSLRAIFIFIRDALLFTDEEIYHCDYYPAPCKVVLMFSNYSILANYSWLLVEGHFLYTLVNRSFFSLKKHLAWYIVLSWGLPLIVIISWGCAKYFYEDEGCWETRRHEWIWWILRVPVLLTISVKLWFSVRVLSSMTPKLLTWGEGRVGERSMLMEKLWDLDKIETVPTSKTSVLLLFSLRKLEENQDLISIRQFEREGGGRIELGLEEM
uniref:Secretin receptor n=1 Tax=Neolamprologus brichardi TaxID=32507 RepID=A0A3Q4HBG5_NEOBR